MCAPLWLSPRLSSRGWTHIRTARLPPEAGQGGARGVVGEPPARSLARHAPSGWAACQHWSGSRPLTKGPGWYGSGRLGWQTQVQVGAANPSAPHLDDDEPDDDPLQPRGVRVVAVVAQPGRRGGWGGARAGGVDLQLDGQHPLPWGCGCTRSLSAHRHPCPAYIRPGMTNSSLPPHPTRLTCPASPAAPGTGCSAPPPACRTPCTE